MLYGHRIGLNPDGVSFGKKKQNKTKRNKTKRNKTKHNIT
eukprot:COSAG06_NODE_711_length_12877_cov_16.318281_4_plen_40_part_00